MNLLDTIDEVIRTFTEDISSVKVSKEIEQLKIKYLGKKGKLTHLMDLLKGCSKEEKPDLGKKINLVKQDISKRLLDKEAHLFEVEQSARLESEWIDVTLPGKPQKLGSKHPVMQMLDRALEILSEMGFSVKCGPDIDSDFYNFESLNFEKDHPARDMQDTFYITTDMLLRTHTSNVQARVMEESDPPIRIVAPGKCFRNETISARSHVFFHQIEGLYIDQGVSFADLLATMDTFWKRLLGKNTKTLFRPSYFPFVEPGMEVDVSCSACKGSGCRICKNTGWLEVAGAGLVHPNVLRSGGLDPEKYSGYAWGMGIERLALLEYGISDIRLFTENDERFLTQFL